MQLDLGSRETSFIELVQGIRSRLLCIAQVDDTQGFTVIPMQGSGTYGIESALTSLVGPSDSLLVLGNGAYGERMVKIAKRAKRHTVTLSASPTERHDLGALKALLASTPSITHVAVVHCETTTGILNPLSEIASIVKAAGKFLIVDAMSSFGGIPVDMATDDIDCLVSSANKCFESVPGFSIIIVKEQLLALAEGNCPSVSLDLFEQWQALNRDGQFRFTPPTHSLLAFEHALDLLAREGGVASRHARYRANHDRLMRGMLQQGFRPVLNPRWQSPIITAFHCPAEADFSFEVFYRELSSRGMVIYPGKLAGLNCFRIGTIGQLSCDDIDQLLQSIREVMQVMSASKCIERPSGE